MGIETVPQGCYPLNTQLKNAITTDPNVIINNYTWIFGDGKSDQGNP